MQKDIKLEAETNI